MIDQKDIAIPRYVACGWKELSKSGKNMSRVWESPVVFAARTCVQLQYCVRVRVCGCIDYT